MASNQPFSSSQVEKAKEAISVLSSIQNQQEQPTTSGQVPLTRLWPQTIHRATHSATSPEEHGFETTRSKGKPTLVFLITLFENLSRATKGS